MAKFPSIYLISQENENDDWLLKKVEASLKAGLLMVQYRQKKLSKKKALLQAHKLRNLTEKYGAKLIINDDTQLALQVRADGVHLGQLDEPIEKVIAKIRIQRQKLLIGISCYNQIERVRTMLGKPEVDLVSIGAIFPSKTKPNAKRADLEFIAQTLTLKAQLKINKPIYAIGGIDSQNVHKLNNIQLPKANSSQKLSGICVSSDLFAGSDTDIQNKVKLFKQTLQTNP